MNFLRPLQNTIITHPTRSSARTVNFRWSEFRNGHQAPGSVHLSTHQMKRLAAIPEGATGIYRLDCRTKPEINPEDAGQLRR